ncbi:mitochondrial ribosomal protein subunit-domain-containing protein [Trametes meyenii]|nr:mitochondrial ribosomal protein subunit-domain-containing protein [Trametes meyenii]
MATPPPSQFAALLRRSKFASFDPNIGQVYTTFDGHAARGNFGLKRPLALRRRNAHITVQAIDSREQQTVWKSAEPQNRWIRMWDETGVTPTSIRDSGAWAARLGALGEIQFSVDSELVPQAEQKEHKMKAADDEEESSMDEPEHLRMSQATRNLDAMSDKEFDWYLRRVRELRPAFRQYLEKHGKNAASDEDKSLLERSLQATGNEFKDFLAHRAFLDYHAPRPRNIEQQPHRYAGLSYTRSPPLQTQLNAKPHVGRVVNSQMTKDKGVVVATAGVTSTLKLGERSTETPSVNTFRFNDVELRTAPVTVGVNPQGLEGVRLTTTVRIDSEETRTRKQNHLPPGSKEYVGYVGAVSPVVGMTTPTAKPTLRRESFPPEDV